MRRLAIFAALAVLAIAACGPMGMPQLDIVVVPKLVPDDGRESVVRVTATTAKGEIGAGTVHVTSTAGSLQDGVDLTLDTYGTATAAFSCNKATEPACSGLVTLTATWNSEKVVTTAEATATIVAPMITGGGAGGGGGGNGTDLNSIVCPTAANRIYVYEGAQAMRVIDASAGKTGQFSCNTSRCEFMEFIGAAPGEPLVLLSVGSPIGTTFVGDTVFTTGMVGNGMVYRVQYASQMRDCGASVGHQFKIENFVIGPTNADTSGQIRFACNPNSGTSSRLTGCLKF